MKAKNLWIGLPIVLVALAGGAAAQDATPVAKGKLSSVTASELIWKMPANVDKSYDTIDGHKLHRYVEEQAAISLRYRDAGNQWWGRISGMPSGAEEQAWVEAKFKEMGMPYEVKPITMAPQDLPKSWDVSVTANGKTMKLESAHPVAGFPGYVPTMEGDEELDSVWVGLGQASDFIGKDVKGKAVYIYSIPTPSTLIQSAQWMGSVARAQKAGAKAIIVQIAVPGNMHYVSPAPGVLRDFKAAIFTVGDQDGNEIEAMNAAGMGKGLKTHVRWKVEHHEALKEAMVIGKLEGTTDENVIMIAHTDGYFQAATDDGAGTAALLGTAEYFVKQPKEQRRRTMYFIATPDHHGGDNGGKWMVENLKPLFPKTLVIVNAEHVAAMHPVIDRVWGTSGEPVLVNSNDSGPSWWGVYGSDKLARIVRDDYALFGVPTHSNEEGSPGELARLQFMAPSFYLHNKGVYYHTDADTPAIVPEDSLTELRCRLSARSSTI